MSRFVYLPTWKAHKSPTSDGKYTIHAWYGTCFTVFSAQSPHIPSSPFLKITQWEGPGSVGRKHVLTNPTRQFSPVDNKSRIVDAQISHKCTEANTLFLCTGGSWNKMDYTFNSLFLLQAVVALTGPLPAGQITCGRFVCINSAWHCLRLLRAPAARWSGATISLSVVFPGRFGLRVASWQQCLRRHLEEMGKNEVLQRAWDGSQNAMDSHALSG